MFEWLFGRLKAKAQSGYDRNKRPAAPPQRRKPNRGPVLADGLNGELLIRYRNPIGELTERTVTIRSVNGVLHRDGSVTLERIDGWCHLRRDDRKFLVNRIMEAADGPGAGFDQHVVPRILRVTGLDCAARPVVRDLLDMPVNSAPSRAVEPVAADFEVVAGATPGRYIITIDTVYGDGVGFEGIARRARTETVRGFGGRKAFSVLPAHEDRARRFQDATGAPVQDVRAWLRQLRIRSR